MRTTYTAVSPNPKAAAAAAAAAASAAASAAADVYRRMTADAAQQQQQQHQQRPAVGAGTAALPVPAAGGLPGLNASVQAASASAAIQPAPPQPLAKGHTAAQGQVAVDVMQQFMQALQAMTQRLPDGSFSGSVSYPPTAPSPTAQSAAVAPSKASASASASASAPALGGRPLSGVTVAVPVEHAQLIAQARGLAQSHVPIPVSAPSVSPAAGAGASAGPGFRAYQEITVAAQTVPYAPSQQQQHQLTASAAATAAPAPVPHVMALEQQLSWLRDQEAALQRELHAELERQQVRQSDAARSRELQLIADLQQSISGSGFRFTPSPGPGASVVAIASPSAASSQQQYPYLPPPPQQQQQQQQQYQPPSSTVSGGYSFHVQSGAASPSVADAEAGATADELRLQHHLWRARRGQELSALTDEYVALARMHQSLVDTLPEGAQFTWRLVEADDAVPASSSSSSSSSSSVVSAGGWGSRRPSVRRRLSVPHDAASAAATSAMLAKQQEEAELAKRERRGSLASVGIAEDLNTPEDEDMEQQIRVLRVEMTRLVDWHRKMLSSELSQ